MTEGKDPTICELRDGHTGIHIGHFAPSLDFFQNPAPEPTFTHIPVRGPGL
ncbi:hypothetical protein ACFXKW_18540 [Streptomyces sp. NPDC059193]|uniref:hypothetical protein n=1 Tax=Streptomyces sp. NPDC059193 TaxID=3346763 RepID=UPI0036BDA133